MFWNSEKDDLREVFPIENLPLEVYSSESRDALSLLYKKHDDSQKPGSPRLPLRSGGKTPDKAVFLKKMLPILDGFDNVLKYACSQHVEGDDVLKNWLKSLESIHRRLLSTLEGEGLVVIDSVGKPLDLTIHEVVETREVTDVRHNYVIEEIAKGFKCGNRILRDAQVVVAKNPDNIGVGISTLDYNDDTGSEIADTYSLEDNNNLDIDGKPDNDQ